MFPYVALDDNTNSVDWVAVCSSCITRLLFWGSTIFVMYVCVQSGYSLTTLHVAFFTLGCALFMVEATLVVSGDALLAGKLSKPARVRVHWILHTVGLACVIVGFVTQIINKDKNGRLHFRSDHGKVGLAGTVVALVVGIGGVPTLFRRIVPQFINFGSFKRTHIYLGIISTILLWAGQITGLYTGWWIRGTSDLATNLTLSAYAIGGFFLIIRPLYRTLCMSYDSSAEP